MFFNNMEVFVSMFWGCKMVQVKQLICDFEIFAIFLVSLLFLALMACKLSLIFDVFNFFYILQKGQEHNENKLISFLIWR